MNGRSARGPRRIAVAAAVALTGLLCFAAPSARAEFPAPEMQKLRALAQTANGVGISTYFLFEGDCALLFVGTEHAFDPSAALFGVLDADWDAFAPQHLIVEGGDWPILADRQAQIRAYGEMGYLSQRARTAGVEVSSFEPTRAEEDRRVLDADTIDTAKLYFVLRMVPQWRNTAGLDAVAPKAAEFLSAFARRTDVPSALIDRRPLSIADIDAMTKALYGPTADWRSIDAHLRIDGQSSPALRAVDAKVNALRNDRLFEAIRQAIDRRKRTMVVAGSTHLAALLRRLEDLPGTCRRS